MILVVLLKFDFGSCIRNREQAFQANGVEGTVSNSSVRKKGGRVEIVASVSLFWGEPQHNRPSLCWRVHWRGVDCWGGWTEDGDGDHRMYCPQDRASGDDPRDAQTEGDIPVLICRRQVTWRFGTRRD